MDAFDLLISFDVQPGFELLDKSIKKMFHLEFPHWLENIHIFCVVNNFLCTYCFRSYNLSNGFFLVFICKGPMNSFSPICIIFIALRSFCFQEEWLNPIYCRNVCASTITTIICREGYKFSQKAFNCSFTVRTSNAIALIDMSHNSFLLASLCLYFKFFLENCEAIRGICFEPVEQSFCFLSRSHHSDYPFVSCYVDGIIGGINFFHGAFKMSSLWSDDLGVINEYQGQLHMNQNYHN